MDFFLANTFISLHGWVTSYLLSFQMIIIPLIFTSIISGIANVGSGDNPGWFQNDCLLSSTKLPIFTGLVIVNIFKPGVGADLGFANQVEGLGVAKESFGKVPNEYRS